MNKFIVMLLTALVAVSCSKSNTKVEMPPWEAPSISAEDKSIYIEEYKCPEATALVKKILAEWHITSSTVEDGATIVVLVDVEGAEAMFVYVDVEGKLEQEIALAIVPGEIEWSPDMIMDFGIAQLVVEMAKLGQDPGLLTLGEASKEAAGNNYYCYFKQ